MLQQRHRVPIIADIRKMFYRESHNNKKKKPPREETCWCFNVEIFSIKSVVRECVYLCMRWWTRTKREILYVYEIIIRRNVRHTESRALCGTTCNTTPEIRHAQSRATLDDPKTIIIIIIVVNDRGPPRTRYRVDRAGVIDV